MFRHVRAMLLALGGAAMALSAEQLPAPSAEWQLLFDGTSSKGWRGFKQPAFPVSGWVVADGRLRHSAGQGGGDIITIETFDDFDLRFQWVVAPGANSGVKYLVTEERDGPIAHEYQVVDDARHPDAQVGPHRATGALYDVLAGPANKPLKPAGEVNDGRIVVNGNHVEHWLNDVKLLEYELGSAALNAAKAKSKFKDEAGWGQKLKGHILLQDHGDDVSFMNIRIRRPGIRDQGSGRHQGAGFRQESGSRDQGMMPKRLRRPGR